MSLVSCENVCQFGVTFKSRLRFSRYWRVGFESKWEVKYEYRHKLGKSNGTNRNTSRNSSERNSKQAVCTLLAAFVICMMGPWWRERILYWQSFCGFGFSAGFHRSIIARVAEHQELCGWCHFITCWWLCPGVQQVLEEKFAGNC